MPKKQLKNKIQNLEKTELIKFLEASIAQVEKDQEQARNFVKLGNDRKQLLKLLLMLVTKQK